MLEGLEDSINEYLDAKQKISDMKKQLQGALSSLNINDIKDGKANISDILNNITPNKEEEVTDKEVTDKEVTDKEVTDKEVTE